MKKSVKIRKIIFEILFEIYQKNINFEESYINFTKNISVNEQDRSLIFNVSLNSMRNYFFVNNLLNQYLKKRTSIKIKILLLTAITQIFYLNFKNYAVTNDTVEIAKIKKLNPGLINALLKNLIYNSNTRNKKKIDLSIVPFWLTQELENNKIKISNFIESFSKEPSLHLVFKNKKILDSFKENIIKTTETSAFLIEKKKIIEIEDYKKGFWWIQDFSSMLPIYMSSEFKSKKIMDLCSAPGGKAFQALSLKNQVFLNDISIKRVGVLKKNLRRLNFDDQVSNINAMDIPQTKKFDVVILDSPCSGIGTIRRNPDILFKKKPPNLKNLTQIQKNLINKAAKLLKQKGILLYMVCSFFYKETKAIKKNFLKDNNNFSQIKFKIKKESKFHKFIDNEGDINCVPTELNGYAVDGFYAVKFIKND